MLQVPLDFPPFKESAKGNPVLIQPECRLRNSLIFPGIQYSRKNKGLSKSKKRKISQRQAIPWCLEPIKRNEMGFPTYPL